MPSPRKPFRLPLQIKVDRSAGLGELEVWIQSYADALCEDMELPVTPSVSVSPAEAGQASLFQIALPGVLCRAPLPALIPPENSPLADYAELICLALFERRTFLLTRELALHIGRDWGLCTESGEWSGGWTAEVFHFFLRQFPAAHFSLGHALRFIADCFVQGLPAGAVSETAAACLFEEAMERGSMLSSIQQASSVKQAADFRFGVTVDISDGEPVRAYRERFAKLTPNLYNDLGCVCPEIRVSQSVLTDYEYQIRINDLRLPVLRGLGRGSKEVIADPTGVHKPGIDSSLRFQPVGGLTSIVVAESAMKAGVEYSNLEPPGYIEGVLGPLLGRNAGSLLMSPAVHLLLRKVRDKAGGALTTGTAKLFSDPARFHRLLTVVLRRLLNEQVPIIELAAILESLLCLREVAKDGVGSVYHFSELPDSPVLVAEGKTLCELSADELMFAARLGLRVLAVRNIEVGLSIPPVLPLPSGFETKLISEGLSQENRDGILELCRMLHPVQDFAIVTDQRHRTRVAELLRYEFPTLRVLGSSEIEKSLIAAGCDTLAGKLFDRNLVKEAFLMTAQAASLEPLSLTYLYHLKLTWQLLGRPAGDEPEYEIAARVNDETGWQIRAADFFFRQGGTNEAKLLYRDLAKVYPRNPLYRVRSGAYRRAIELYRQAFGSAEPDTDSLYSFFDALILEGDYTGDPELKRKYWDEARKLSEGAVKRAPENPWFHNELGIALERLRSWEAACESFLRCTKLHKQHVGAWRGLAYCLAQQAKFAEAFSTLEEAREANPAVSVIRMDLARAYAQAERFDAAVALARELSQSESPAKESPATEAAQLLSALEKAEQAAAQLKKEPPSAQIDSAFARLHEQLGNLPAAAARYRSAMLADPAEPLYRRSLAGTLANMGDWREAAAEYETTLKSMPDDAFTLYGLGVACDALGDTEKSRSYFEQAASRAPEQERAHSKLGAAEYRLGHIEKARDAYRAAIRINDKYAWAHYSLGNCHYRLGEIDQAIDEWRKALQIDGNIIEAIFNLGVAHPEEAAAQWTEALRQDPNLTFAEDNLNALEQHKPPPHLEIFDLLNLRC